MCSKPTVWKDRQLALWLPMVCLRDSRDVRRAWLWARTALSVSFPGIDHSSSSLRVQRRTSFVQWRVIAGDGHHMCQTSSYWMKRWWPATRRYVAWSVSPRDDLVGISFDSSVAQTML